MWQLTVDKRQSLLLCSHDNHGLEMARIPPVMASLHHVCAKPHWMEAASLAKACTDSFGATLQPRGRRRACRMCERRGKISPASGSLATERVASMCRMTSSRSARGSCRLPTNFCTRCTCARTRPAFPESGASANYSSVHAHVAAGDQDRVGLHVPHGSDRIGHGRVCQGMVGNT